MKLSFCQMIAIVSILAVGFITVAPFLPQEAYGGADQYDYDAYELRYYPTGQFAGRIIVGGGLVQTSHWGYYHSPGAPGHSWGHSVITNINIIGIIWI